LQELTQLRGGASMISEGAPPWPPPGYVPDLYVCMRFRSYCFTPSFIYFIVKV